MSQIPSGQPTIWPDRIGLRFDCGDAGVVLLDQQKTQEVIDELQRMQKAMGWAGRTA